MLAIFSEALGEAEDIDESADLIFGLSDETTITSTTLIPSTTNDPIPKTGIKRCGLYENKTCVKRFDCSTTMRSGSKLIVDVKVRAKSVCHPDDMVGSGK